VVFRHAPFVVVIGDVERILFGPRTARDPIGVEDGLAHSAAFASPGQANRAQSGLRSAMAMPPAAIGCPAGRGAATRASRSMASPCPAADEPMVPTLLSPAVTTTPASGANPS